MAVRVIGVGGVDDETYNEATAINVSDGHLVVSRPDAQTVSGFSTAALYAPGKWVSAKILPAGASA